MTTANDVRRLHKLLDKVAEIQALDSFDIEHLRATLPDLPKQKTLAEICEDVALSLNKTNGDEWGDEAVYLESWLKELHAQLNGIKDAPADVPALPEGMRLADHKVYGRVVVSTEKDVVGCYAAFRLGNWNFSGIADHYVSPGALTFIDDEPAEPAHPEFLETEADYQSAPEGTIVAKDDISTAWIKRSGAWKSTDGDRGVRCPNWKVGHRIILRWGWKK